MSQDIKRWLGWFGALVLIVIFGVVVSRHLQRRLAKQEYERRLEDPYEVRAVINNVRIGMTWEKAADIAGDCPGVSFRTIGDDSSRFPSSKTYSDTSADWPAPSKNELDWYYIVIGDDGRVVGKYMPGR